MMSNTLDGSAPKPQMTTVRSLMLAQMKALRDAPVGEKLRDEIARSKGMAELGGVLIDSAKAEVDYLKLTGQEKSDFLEIPPDAGVAHLGSTATGNLSQVGGRTFHRIRG
jgi:hypothetical protein